MIPKRELNDRQYNIKQIDLKVVHKTCTEILRLTDINLTKNGVDSALQTGKLILLHCSHSWCYSCYTLYVMLKDDYEETKVVIRSRKLNEQTIVCPTEKRRTDNIVFNRKGRTDNIMSNRKGRTDNIMSNRKRTNRQYNVQQKKDEQTI